MFRAVALTNKGKNLVCVWEGGGGGTELHVAIELSFVKIAQLGMELKLCTQLQGARLLEVKVV